jgi:hypothetical protein
MIETKRACRIRYDMTTGGYKDDETNWQTIQTAMICLENALSSFIASLTQTK